MNVTVPAGTGCVNNVYLAICLSALTNICKLTTKLSISVFLRFLSVSVHSNTTLHYSIHMRHHLATFVDASTDKN